MMERFKQVSRSERASALQRQTFCFRIRARWAWRVKPEPPNSPKVINASSTLFIQSFKFLKPVSRISKNSSLSISFIKIPSLSIIN
jgi:hypothetical protein